MPIIGYVCGTTIRSFISTYAPWIAFILLLCIGLNMILESITSSDEKVADIFSFKEVTLLAIATSIDAFAVGVTFAILNISLVIPCAIIGIITFLFSIVGIFNCDDLIDKKFEKLKKDYIEENAYSLRSDYSG